MRIGIVLTITFNLPLSQIEAAGLHAHADGSGDIASACSTGTDRIAYLHLWPHARPWQPEAHPADAARVAAGCERGGHCWRSALADSADRPAVAARGVDAAPTDSQPVLGRRPGAGRLIDRPCKPSGHPS